MVDEKDTAEVGHCATCGGETVEGERWHFSEVGGETIRHTAAREDDLSWKVEIPPSLVENATVGVSMKIRVNGQDLTIGGGGNHAGVFELTEREYDD